MGYILDENGKNDILCPAMVYVDVTILFTRIWPGMLAMVMTIHKGTEEITKSIIDFCEGEMRAVSPMPRQPQQADKGVVIDGDACGGEESSLAEEEKGLSTVEGDIYVDKQVKSVLTHIKSGSTKLFCKYNADSHQTTYIHNDIYNSC
eukprot:7050641-Ditylum_brightwellii.AAC.1